MTTKLQRTNCVKLKVHSNTPFLTHMVSFMNNDKWNLKYSLRWLENVFSSEVLYKHQSWKHLPVGN